MNVPQDLKYTKSHEWIKVEADGVTIGISDFAQAQLGDLTFVELPSVGDTVNAGDDVAVVESVKAASDVYAPVSGTVIAVNEALEDSPELINSDAFGDGWMFKVELSDAAQLDGLLTPEDYAGLAPGEA
ncbi:MAG: glycine cleavage system H protein [Verrucomicrobiales bacterium]|jgi:glycine cleavage system H protein